MVNRIAVNRSEASLALQHPVAELLHSGFRCTIAFVPEGTQIKFEDKKYVTSREHWLDMDLDDFCDVFEEHPDDIEYWFDQAWPTLMEKLEMVENNMPKARGGVIPASATASMLKMMSSMDELSLTCKRTGRGVSDMMDAMRYNIHSASSVGMKVMKPNPVTVTITNPNS